MARVLKLLACTCTRGAVVGVVGLAPGHAVELMRPTRWSQPAGAQHLIASTMFVIVNVLAVAAVGAGLLHGAAASPAASSCHDSVCDIRSFGAVGDNVTVDTSAIQAALDAAAALPGGGTVLVSA